MFGWSTNREEYDHVRKIILDAPLLTKAVVNLKGGNSISGVVSGTNSRNDAGENIRLGRCPVVSSIFGEIILRLDNGQALVLNALEIDSIHAT